MKDSTEKAWYNFQMPIYDYYCLACDRGSEENVPIRERDYPQKCVCGHLKWRLLSFKGSVWAPSARNGGQAR